MENIVETGNQSQQSFDVDLSALENIQIDQPATNSPNPDVHTNTDESQIEIDERFKDLDPAEARIRTLKSRADKAEAQYNKLMKDYDERDQVAGLLDQMLEDEGLLMAFIAETKPDLVKSRDTARELKEQLKKEFGEDFKPQLTREEAERDDPFGNDYKYYMRLDELKGKLKSGGEAPQSVKDYLKAKRAKEEAEKQRYALEKESVKNQFKMTDDELVAVSDWALKLQFADLVKVHRFLRKFPTRNPNLTTVPGGGESVKSAKQKYLDELLPINRR